MLLFLKIEKQKIIKLKHYPKFFLFMSFFNKKKKIQKKLVVSSKFIKRSSHYIRKQIHHNPFKVFPSNDNFFEEDEEDYFSLNEIDDESKRKSIFF